MVGVGIKHIKQLAKIKKSYHIQVSVENINWESIAELLSNFDAIKNKIRERYI